MRTKLCGSWFKLQPIFNFSLVVNCFLGPLKEQEKNVTTTWLSWLLQANLHRDNNPCKAIDSSLWIMRCYHQVHSTVCILSIYFIWLYYILLSCFHLAEHAKQIHNLCKVPPMDFSVQWEDSLVKPWFTKLFCEMLA